VSALRDRLDAVARELPIAGAQPERADARRNRERILAAAAELIGERGLGQVRMDEVAARAGVAKGTVFQRFGNRAGLAVALVDSSERRLQDALLAGPPPLGPGAPPADRLRAFLGALLELTIANLELLLISDYDSPGDRYRTGAYAAWRLHVSVLLQDAGHPSARADGLAHLVLAPLAADLVRHRLRDEGAEAATLEAELDVLASVVAAKSKPRTRRRK
jgi:AcrR family transcriptional regulator